jgi:Arc/MetJ-type ribon-helix-helix transcriptional regulator
MGKPKDQEIKVRVPEAMKLAVKALADRRFSSESEIARAALLEYLERHRALQESPDAVPAISSATAESVASDFADDVIAAAKRAPSPSQKVTYKIPRRTKKTRPPKTSST